MSVVQITLHYTSHKKTDSLPVTVGIPKPSMYCIHVDIGKITDNPSLSLSIILWC